MLGTVERNDGTTQVTYNNLPLYHFSRDEAAGETNGQALNDVWWWCPLRVIRSWSNTLARVTVGGHAPSTQRMSKSSYYVTARRSPSSPFETSSYAPGSALPRAETALRSLGGP
ncbi:MAG: hypothetical protein ACRDGU_07230 [Actinomycetota bacterium]